MAWKNKLISVKDRIPQPALSNKLSSNLGILSIDKKTKPPLCLFSKIKPAQPHSFWGIFVQSGLKKCGEGDSNLVFINQLQKIIIKILKVKKISIFLEMLCLRVWLFFVCLFFDPLCWNFCLKSPASYLNLMSSLFTLTVIEIKGLFPFFLDRYFQSDINTLDSGNAMKKMKEYYRRSDSADFCKAFPTGRSFSYRCFPPIYIQ